MRGFLGVLRRGWRSLRSPVGPPVPFEVSCSCGQVQRGLRFGRAQVVRCPGCGEAVFILPRSPLPPLPDETVAPAAARPGRSPWLLPLTAAVGTLLAVVVLYIVLFSSWLRPHASMEDNASQAEEPRGSAAAGQKLLQEGNFREALKQFDAAGARTSRDPALRQLHHQADLLARLLHQSLEEIVEQGQMLRRPDEWQEQFKDYKGRAVLFEDVVRRDENGRFHLSVYQVRAGDEKAVVRLDLELLRRLPLDQPRRLLFGARLASVKREDGGFWVIRFEPDSGVLLTDEGAASACGLGPLDAGLREVIRWQAQWIRSH